MADDTRQWMMMGFFAGIEDKPLDTVLAPIEAALQDRVRSLQDVTASFDREVEDRHSIYERLGAIFRDEEHQWRSLLLRAEQSTDALETVRSHGGLSWLLVATAGVLLPIAASALRAETIGLATLAIPAALVLASMLAAWRGIALYMSQRLLRALLEFDATRVLLFVIGVLGAAVTYLSAALAWQTTGVIGAGISSGVAVACRWAYRHAQVAIVSDLTRALEQARADSSSRHSERTHGRDRLRASRDEAIHELNSIEADRTHIRKHVALGHHLGSALRRKRP